MVLGLVITGLLIAIVVLSIRYFMAYAHLTSHKSFDREAKKAAQSYIYKDPKITCDFCGGTVDTNSDKVCPHCGADYSLDKEWIRRHRVDQDKVDKEADDFADEEVSRAEQKAHEIAKLLRNAILILIGIVAALIILALIVDKLEDEHNYAKDGELNEYSYDDYVPIANSVEGDGVILHANDITVSIDGIYVSEDNFGCFKIGYHIVNESKEARNVCFYLTSVDYVAVDHITYEWIKGGSDIIFYEQYYDLDAAPATISRLVYGDFSITDEDYTYLFDSQIPVTVYTDGPALVANELPTENIVFENDYVLITDVKTDQDSDPTTPDEDLVTIYNKSDYYMIVSCEDGKLNGSIISTSGFYESAIPGQCYGTEYVISYDDTYDTRSAEDSFSFVISFDFTEDPSLNFSTGYLEAE